MPLLAVIGIVVGIIAALGLVVAMFRNPKVWLGTVLLLLPYFLFDSGKGLSISEAIVGAFIIGSVTIWTIFKVSTGYKLIRGWSDLFIVGFIALSSLNVIIALANEVKLLDWLTEWMLFLILLYYFPLREYFGRSEHDLRSFLVLLAVSTLVMAGLTAYDYYARSSEGLLYAYQILASRSRLFAPVFVGGALLALTAIFHVRTWRSRLLLVALTAVNLAGILQSFTRSLWVAFLVCVAIVCFFLSFTQNLRLVAACILAIGCMYAAAYTVNPHLTNIVTRIISKRFSTSTQFKGGDYSFEVRVIEADVAWRDIKRYPLGGAGIQAKILAWDPIVGYHIHKPFIHIGYLSLLYKLGPALSVLLVSVLIIFAARSFQGAMLVRNRMTSKPIVRSVAISMLAFQPAVFSFIAVAGFFDQRYGNSMLAIMFALVGISHQLALDGDTETTTDQTAGHSDPYLSTSHQQS